MGAGARAEDFQDKTRAVDDFGIPCAFQITLLDRRQRGIDDYHTDFPRLDEAGKLVDRALAEECRRAHLLRPHRLGMDDVKFDGLRQPNCLFKTQFRVARPYPVGDNRVQDERAARAAFDEVLLSRHPGYDRLVSGRWLRLLFRLGGSLRLEQLNRLRRHNRGNCMLVNKL